MKISPLSFSFPYPKGGKKKDNNTSYFKSALYFQLSLGLGQNENHQSLSNKFFIFRLPLGSE
jgi:hypothetical protein